MVNVVRSDRLRDSHAVTVIEEIDELSMMDPRGIRQNHVWYAKISAEIAGVAVVEPKSEERARVKRIGVLSEYRGQGIGRAIVEQLYNEYGPLAAYVRRGASANGFYDALGWEAVETDVKLNKYVYG